MDPREGLPSASAMGALAACLGRWNACRDIPEPPPSPDALEGTLAHSVMAGATDRTAISDELAEQCDIARRLRDQIAAEYFGEATLDDIWVEERFWLPDPETLQPIMSGQADWVGKHDGRLLVIDYKFGRQAVEFADSNMQLRALAALCAESYDVSEIMVAIIQPRVFPAITKCVYSQDDIRQALDEVRDILTSARDPNAPRTPGPVQCRYCRAQATCPEFRGQPTELPAVVQAAQPLEALDAGLLAQLGDRCVVAEQAIDTIRAELKRRLGENPDSVPGWSLKPGAVRQVILDADTVFTRFSYRGGRTDEFLPAVSIQKGKLEAAVKATFSAKGKELKALMATLLDGCVEEKQTAPSLVRQ